jgi:transcriptional regulator with XRE-family HTH domain
MTNQEAKEYLGKYVAKRLIRMSGSQEELGDFFGVSATLIWNILNGYYERVSVRMYMEMARKLEIEIDVYVVGED